MAASGPGKPIAQGGIASEKRGALGIGRHASIMRQSGDSSFFLEHPDRCMMGAFREFYNPKHLDIFGEMGYTSTRRQPMFRGVGVPVDWLAPQITVWGASSCACGRGPVRAGA